MRKRKVKPTFKVYCTYYPTGEFYIGFSSKMGKPYENYFGSNKDILTLVKENPDHKLLKETIAEFDKKSHAKMCEFLLQWKNRDNPLCLNDMINIRLRMSHLEDFEEINWQPSFYEDVLLYHQQSS